MDSQLSFNDFSADNWHSSTNVNYYGSSNNNFNSNNNYGSSHYTPIQPVTNYDLDLQSTSEYTTQSMRERSRATAFRRRNVGDGADQSAMFSGAMNNDNVGSGNRSYNNNPTSNHKKSLWNNLNITLFLINLLLSASISIPVTLIPTMARSFSTNADGQWTYYTFDQGVEVYSGDGRKWWVPFRVRTRRENGNDNSGNYNNNNNKEQDITASQLASRLAITSMLSQSLGKIINGPLIDISGARRLLLLYGMATSLVLWGLSHTTTSRGVILSCAAIEFFSSVFWPCVVVLLGGHYGQHDVRTGPSDGQFEKGINVASIASRCGSLLVMPFSSLMLRWSIYDWRDLIKLASFSMGMGVLISFLCLTDSPGKVHDPQNPIRMPSSSLRYSKESRVETMISYIKGAMRTVFPSLRTVLGSKVFWMLSAAHAGATMVKSSERILGTYYVDTSYGMATEGKAGAMTVFLPLGMLGGLILGGRAFARAADEERAIEETERSTTIPKEELDISTSFVDATQLRPKNMIAFLYCLAICMCYMLSFLAMPFVRRALILPEIVLILQVLISMGLGAGVAVQFYHIPVIVGATYGHNRGLYQAYTDGVAAFISSLAWRIVGRAVEEGDPESYGWAYGWAGVALLLILCGTLMVGIMEVYFVGGGWRHHLVQHDRSRLDDSFPNELPTDLNGSWMEDEIMSTGLSLDDTSMKRRGGIRILSSSAIEFLSPSRSNHRRNTTSLLTIVDSRDEEEASRVEEADLLGIDDDGSVLHPRRGAEGETIDTIVNRRNNLHPTSPFDASTEISGEYLSFTNVRDQKKCQLTFTKSEDEHSVRATSTFEYPESTVSNNATRNRNGSRDNREARIPSPIDAFSL